MLNKNIIIFLACVIASTTTAELSPVQADSHIINDCIDPGDNPMVLYDQDVAKGGHILRYETQTVRIPASGFAQGLISCLTVTNLDSSKDGGYPTIQEGGVGFNYVIVQLKSQFGKGFDFRVTAYYSG